MAMNSNQAVIGIEAKVYFNPYQEVTVINGYIHKHCFMPDGRRSQVSYYPVPIGDQTFYTCDLKYGMYYHDDPWIWTTEGWNERGLTDSEMDILYEMTTDISVTGHYH